VVRLSRLAVGGVRLVMRLVVSLIVVLEWLLLSMVSVMMMSSVRLGVVSG